MISVCTYNKDGRGVGSGRCCIDITHGPLPMRQPGGASLLAEGAGLAYGDGQESVSYAEPRLLNNAFE